jgi:aryl-alcohol dehydrogenase-like predicted oxidoreductase
MTSAARVRIGRAIEVNRVGFGALHVSGPGMWGPPADAGAARRLLRRALELGVQFIDTADTYGGSEDAIADALHPYPPGLVIATKGGLERDGPEFGEFTPWPRNARPEQLRRACESSLRRLRLDCIELYQLHSPDPRVPLEESIGALTDLQAEGKIKHIGVSNVTLQQLEVALDCAELVSVQNSYSLGDRESEQVLARCEQEGLTFIAWYPLANGTLSSGGTLLSEIAQRHGATPTQVAIAWLLARSPLLLPIPGTSSIEHLEENVAAAQLELDQGDVALLNDCA